MLNANIKVFYGLCNVVHMQFPQRIFSSIMSTSICDNLSFLETNCFANLGFGGAQNIIGLHFFWDQGACDTSFVRIVRVAKFI